MEMEIYLHRKDWLCGVLQYGIPEWLLKNNLRPDVYSFAIDEPEDVEVVRETEKALLLDLVTGFGTYKMWAPKSVVKGF